MSKVLDALNKSVHSKDKIGTSIQEEIANIYLQTSDKKTKQKKFIRISKIPWIIALITSFLAFLALIFKSDIDIKIRISGEVPTFKKGLTQDQPQHVIEKGIFFITGGEFDKDIVKGTSFLGDAGAFSNATNSELVLCNSRGYGWANYTIELKEPIDLSRFDIRYTAKGARGDEHLMLVIVDADNRSYRIEKDSSSSALTKDWQRYAITFSSIKDAVNLKDISIIRFEFGSLTAGNHSTATIFLKDIYITKIKRFKWL